jgi:hypothetical protein
MSDDDVNLDDLRPRHINDVGAAWAELLAYMGEHDDASSFASDLALEGAYRDSLMRAADRWEQWDAHPVALAAVLRSIAPAYPPRS